MKWLSFVIPVYNDEPYLVKCLESILHQDVPQDDYEIICVNDGSTDGSRSILDNYAERFSNIRVLDKNNGGVSSARNMGIDVAVGDYIWFVDADDFIETNILFRIKSIVLLEKPDLLSMNAFAFDDNENEFALTKQENESRDNLLGIRTRVYNATLWMNLFRREIIARNKLRFDLRLKNREDVLFYYQFESFCSDKREIDEIVYFHRKRQGSLTSTVDDEGTIPFLCEIKKCLDKRTGDNYCLTRILSRSLKSLLFKTAWMPRTEARKRIVELKNNNLFPLPWNYFTKQNNVWTVNKRPDNGIYNRLFNKTYNRIFTYPDFLLIRMDYHLKRFIRFIKK